jgi:hypothetical protein
VYLQRSDWFAHTTISVASKSIKQYTLQLQTVSALIAQTLSNTLGRRAPYRNGLAAMMLQKNRSPSHCQSGSNTSRKSTLPPSGAPSECRYKRSHRQVPAAPQVSTDYDLFSQLTSRMDELLKLPAEMNILKIFKTLQKLQRRYVILYLCLSVVLSLDLTEVSTILCILKGLDFGLHILALLEC